MNADDRFDRHTTPESAGPPGRDDAPTDVHSPVGDEAAPTRRGPRRGLLHNPIRVVLVAVVVGAIVAGGIAIAAGVLDDRGNVATSDIGTPGLAQNDFTRSKTGDCLQWPEGQPGDPTKVGCEAPHRFEVAGALDTGLLPGSEFGDSAPWPGIERFGTIRDEQCPVIVDGYLAGRLDPQGRFSVGMMYPSEAQWQKGARELRCGLQQTGKDGEPVETTGRVADQDQSFQWPTGTCVGIDEKTRRPSVPAGAVECAAPHAFQTTGVVDLATRFGAKNSGRPWPKIADQNAFLATICPVQAERFVGGKNKLDQTTLNVQWSVINEPSWLAGSRKVVCYLGLPDRGGFATLVGDARSSVLINGKLPVPPPQAPPGRALPTPVPLPPGVEPNPTEAPAPAG
ncbi:hypothetical protein GCM10009624_27520 [Gordonia sinesedis]